ncbi:hypothetical protein [Mycobacterium sp. AT1]|uniref:hypothetical protein n=1 Tax=Mycobacterium sp. AT1 TaxID=1961706 RepID=UPI00114F98BD|nr:hypothetical protein [Mycobacterium sp. AT1]
MAKFVSDGESHPWFKCRTLSKKYPWPGRFKADRQGFASVLGVPVFVKKISPIRDHLSHLNWKFMSVVAGHSICQL